MFQRFTTAVEKEYLCLGEIDRSPGTPGPCRMDSTLVKKKHGSLNVPIEHHPTIRYMVYNGYYKVMSNIPKMGQLPTPEK